MRGVSQRDTGTMRNIQVALTLADWTWIWVVPGAVGLTANDSLTPVVITWVTYKHHDGIVLVLCSIDQPPSPMLHSRVADVRAGHSCRGKGLAHINCLNMNLTLVG